MSEKKRLRLAKCRLRPLFEEGRLGELEDTLELMLEVMLQQADLFTENARSLKDLKFQVDKQRAHLEALESAATSQEHAAPELHKVGRASPSKVQEAKSRSAKAPTQRPVEVSRMQAALEKAVATAGANSKGKILQRAAEEGKAYEKAEEKMVANHVEKPAGLTFDENCAADQMETYGAAGETATQNNMFFETALNAARAKTTIAQEEGFYKVVHDKIAVRTGPSDAAAICSAVVKDLRVVGTPCQVGVMQWLRLNIEKSPSARVPRNVPEAWILIDGEPLGFPLLLQRTEDPEVLAVKEAAAATGKHVRSPLGLLWEHAMEKAAAEKPEEIARQVPVERVGVEKAATTKVAMGTLQAFAHFQKLPLGRGGLLKKPTVYKAIDGTIKSLMDLEGVYQVLPAGVRIREAPSLDADVRGMVEKGAEVVGSPYLVDATQWLRLNIGDSSSGAVFSPSISNAWMLIDGAPLGLPMLLHRIKDSQRDRRAVLDELVWQCNPFLPDIPRAYQRIWAVVGGIGKGGIRVRQTQDINSERFSLKLSAGALIEELEIEGNRLHYKRYHGDGPDHGWVTIEHKGKPLVELYEDID